MVKFEILYKGPVYEETLTEYDKIAIRRRGIIDTQIRKYQTDMGRFAHLREKRTMKKA